MVEPLAKGHVESRWLQLVEPPTFIVGPARSGTTWVYDILTAHPRVAGVSESFLFTSISQLFGPLHSYGERPDAKRAGVGRLTDRADLIREIRRLASSLFGRVIGPDQRFLVEKSGPHLWCVDLISEVFPGARFVNVVRDGRDLCVSVLAAAGSWAPGWRRSAWAASVEGAARNWSEYVVEARAVAGRVGSRMTDVRYEALHDDPTTNYRRLFDFCRIPYDSKLLEHVFGATDFARNYTPDEAAFRRGGRVGDWRTRFGRADRVSFDRAAGETLVALGYEPDHLWVRRRR